MRMRNCGRPRKSDSARFLLLATLATSGSLAMGQQQAPLPFQDTKASVPARVDDLISRMTLDEKAAQMSDHAAAIPRLGIPAYGWWNEGLHGLARAGYATVFPQAIAMAATWDPALVQLEGSVVSTEAREIYNRVPQNADHARYHGLTIWSPNINIFRDPRWGRGQETYGEDPYLTSQIGVAFVRGIQGPDPTYLKAVATPKHFAVHSGPEPDRHGFNVPASPHDLEETYLPAFRATILDGKAGSIMCAYNAVDGEPACANQNLLVDHLRKDWGFQGFVVSDCDAVDDILTGHHFAPDAAHAAAVALKAGTDLDCGSAYRALPDAVKQGLITEADIDVSLRRLFLARFRLGMFDPPRSLPDSLTPAARRQLSLRAARESIVLLKNANGILPLSPAVRKIAVVGPDADLLQALEGNYHGSLQNPVSPLAGITQRFAGRASVVYAQGSALADGKGVPVPTSALRTTGNPSIHGLTGEYFPNRNWQGQPAAVRVDPRINFDWGEASPIAGVSGLADYSVRWSGQLVPPAPGDYTLGVRAQGCTPPHCNMNYHLYLDGKLLADFDTQTNHAPLHFAGTEPHTLRLEYSVGKEISREHPGIDLVWEAGKPLLDQAVRTAQDADIIVACLGLSPELEGEEMKGVKLDGFLGGDRTSTDLPAPQQKLLEAMVATGKPVVVVLMSGSALSVNWAQQHAPAILEAWYPGEEGGNAIADTLAGLNNPSGRLPITFYQSVAQLPPFKDYSMQGRTYRYFTAEPLYEFGFGLSYTSFAYAHLKLSSPIVNAGDTLSVDVDVRNTGKTAGDEVVQLYLTPPRAETNPLRSLEGIARVTLAPSETKHVHFDLTPRQLSLVSSDGTRSVLPGEYHLAVGGGQPTHAPDATTTFVIQGKQVLPK